MKLGWTFKNTNQRDKKGGYYMIKKEV